LSFRLSGAPNFRDLGHYQGAAGLAVRAGRLFRADHLGELTTEDAARIAALGLRRVVDFRGVDERVAVPCVLEAVTVHSLPIEPTIVQKLTGLIAAGQQPTPADAIALMRETYRGFVRGNTHRFAQLFAHLLESDQPTVFHCTAGKDRTGFAAALILRSLGVSAEDAMRDYLLTNDYLRPPEVSRHRLSPQVASVLWQVRPEFLNAAFEAVETDYGGLEAYFREGLRLGDAQRDRLRELYLVDAPS
jgi:protein-tyrosine phosphatase